MEESDMAGIKEFIGSFLALDSAFSLLESIPSYQNALNAATANSANVTFAITELIIDYIIGLFNPTNLILGMLISILVVLGTNRR
jgi:hypothetical protein